MWSRACVRWHRASRTYPSSLGQFLIRAGITAFGLALLTLLLCIAYVGSYAPGLGLVGWFLVGVGTAHLMRGTRRGDSLTGLRYAVVCAAMPFMMITQAFLTTMLLFGGMFVFLAIIQFLVALRPRRRNRP